MTEHNIDPAVESIAVVDIDADLAKEWQAYNTHNRRVAQRSSASLVQAILRGEWIKNGETIKLGTDAEGNNWLLDGQHRLEGIVKAQEALEDAANDAEGCDCEACAARARGVHRIVVQSYVVTGLSAKETPTVQETIDTGRKRTVADMLNLRHEKDYNNLAAALRLVHRLLRHQDLRAPGYVETPQQLIALLEEIGGDPDDKTVEGMRRSIRAASTYTVIGMPKSLIAALHYTFGLINPVDRDDFFEKLHSGDMLAKRDPINVLRKWLLAREFETAKAVTHWVGAVSIKAWNAYRVGRQVTLISWKGGGKRPERYPLIHGLEAAIKRGAPELDDERATEVEEYEEQVEEHEEQVA
jgi:hypothetical protein